ncbi:MAG: lipid-A-disaccharide synthase, partial [Prevotella sp.]|nr:lipid-A-disaccharide synthase [Prevotella sp.]
AVSDLSDYQLVLAGAPSIDDDYYAKYIHGTRVRLVHQDTFALLSHATAALVTSGTATLETALFNVPQVVCYETPLPHFIRFCFNHIIKVKYISLVNLIADKEIVKELLADKFKVSLIKDELVKLLPGNLSRQKMLDEYQEVRRALGDSVAPDNAARLMVQLLRNNKV